MNVFCIFSLLLSWIIVSYQGDNNESAPWAVQVAAKAKYDAWKSRAGMSKADAEAAYVKAAEGLITKYGLKA